LLHGIYG